MKQEKIYLNYDQVEKYCLDMARDMMLDSWLPDYIVGITRGGLLPATLLSQFLEVPMFSLDVSLRDSSALPTSNAWMAEDALAGKAILIVDDINDTGATLQWIEDDWKGSNLPDSPEWEEVFGENVRVAVLVDNEASSFIKTEYRGLGINKTEKDEWYVFPWEDFWRAGEVT